MASRLIHILSKLSLSSNSKDAIIARNLSQKNLNELKNISALKLIPLSDNDYELNLPSNLKVFINESSFFKNCHYSFIEKELLIKTQNGSIIYSNGNFKDEIATQDIKNCIAHLTLIAAIKRNHEDHTKQSTLADTFNEHDQIIAFNPPKRPKQVISFGRTGFDSSIDLPNEFPSIVERFISYLKDDEKTSFLKKVICDSLKHDSEKNLYSIEKNIDGLTESAKIDYEIYLNRYTFDEQNNILRSKKDGYFRSVQSSIDKVYSRISSLPLSISASFLSIYNLQDTPLLMSLVALAFIIYACYNTYIIYFFERDIALIKKRFNSDYSIIRNRSGFPESNLDNYYKEVVNKFDFTETTIKATYIIFIAFSLLTAVVIIFKIDSSYIFKIRHITDISMMSGIFYFLMILFWAIIGHEKREKNLQSLDI
ncbi:MAG: hypothetical protein ACQETE_01745 [Bacteroidota bacterium]